MADAKISQLTPITGANLQDTDLFVVARPAGELNFSLTRAEMFIAAPEISTETLSITTIQAFDGTSAGSIADSTGVVTLASAVLTTADINGGTIDGTVIGGSTAAAGSFTSVSATGLTVNLPQGDIVFEDLNDQSVDSDSGMVLTGGSAIRSAIFTEVNGEILSYAINTAQIDSSFDQSRAGAIFRLDMRASGPAGNASCFVVKARSAGDTAEFNGLVVNVNSGDTLLSPVKGNVGVGTTTPATALDVNGTITASQYNSTEALPDIKPSLNLDFANTKKLDPRITFTRGSTAAYYDGVTFAKAEENLLPYSQDFTQSWVNTNSTDTGDTETAPDGTTTADTLTDDAASGSHNVFLGSGQGLTLTANTNYAFSCFAKAGTADHVLLAVTDAGNVQRFFCADFDLAGGTVRTSAAGTSGTLDSATITSVGNGWYRCSIIGEVALVSATTRAIIAVSDGITALNAFGTVAYSGTGSTVFLWGAQLEQRSALTDYTPTTDQPITNYIPALQTAASGEARFDHDPITGESKGLLIEEPRTNLILYSEQFDNAAWARAGSSITSNIVVAPDGTLTGDKLVENTGTSEHFAEQIATLSPAAGTYTHSVFVKAAERSLIQFRPVHLGANEGSTSSIIVNLLTGAITGATPAVDSSSIQDVGNGWWRVSVTITTTGTVTSNRFRVQVLSGVSGFTYTGDGYSGIYVWGAQLEAGVFPTSYIGPTVASQVTRSADAASMTGTNFSSWYRQDEGSVYVNYSAPDLGNFLISDPYVVGFSGGALATNSPRISLRLEDANNSVALQVVDASGSGVSASITGGIPANLTDSRVSAAYAVDDFAISVFDNAVVTDTSGYVPAGGITQLHIGHGGSLNGHIKKLAYYPKRLSNQTLQALTEE